MIKIKSKIIKYNQLIAGILPFTLLFNYLHYDRIDPYYMSGNYIGYYFLIILSISVVVGAYAYFFRRILEKIILLLKLNDRIIDKEPLIIGDDIVEPKKI